MSQKFSFNLIVDSLDIVFGRLTWNEIRLMSLTVLLGVIPRVSDSKKHLNISEISQKQKDLCSQVLIKNPGLRKNRAIPVNPDNSFINGLKKIHKLENISITEEEYNQLEVRFGKKKTDSMLENVSLWKRTKNIVYESDFYACQRFFKNDKELKKLKSQKDPNTVIIEKAINE